MKSIIQSLLTIALTLITSLSHGVTTPDWVVLSDLESYHNQVQELKQREAELHEKLRETQQNLNQLINGQSNLEQKLQETIAFENDTRQRLEKPMTQQKRKQGEELLARFAARAEDYRQALAQYRNLQTTAEQQLVALQEEIHLINEQLNVLDRVAEERLPLKRQELNPARQS